MRFLTFCLMLACTTHTIAQEQVVDFDTQQTMPAELAAVAVLGEICPTLINADQAFKKGYNKVIGELLPNAKNPVAEFKILTESNDYNEVMSIEREFAKNAGEQENREICLAIQQYGQ